MLTTMRYILLLFLILFSNKIVCQTDDFPSRKPIVIIDPGHGGRDSGALSRNGVMEKDIVLSIALKMDSINRYFYNDKLDLYLTRYTDTLISLRDRTRLAKVLKADVFISLHCNSSVNVSATGSEVYIYPKSEAQAEESAYLGFSIQKGLADLLGIENRGLRYGDFQVLRDFTSGTSILLELGYLSNGDEATYLSHITLQLAIASVIFPILNLK